MRRPVHRIRRALVTGASSGLGAEFARQLAARGTDLVLVARREDRLRELADELTADGRTVEVLAADLVDPHDLARVERRVAATQAPVDLLVNNAGVGAYGPFDGIDVDRQAALIQLNVVALTRLTHAVLPSLRTAGGGGVLNVASTAAFQPDPFGAVYGATKAFVRSFTEALHEELAGTGVRVTALCPGLTSTEFQDRSGVRAGGLPDVVAMDVAPVVRAGLDAFSRGRAVCVPGMLNTVTAWGAEVTPAALTRRLSRIAHERYTA